MIIKNPKAVIFDWDGTLANSRPAFVNALEPVLKKYGKEEWKITKKKYHNPVISLKENFPNYFGNDYKEAYQEYVDNYKNKTTHLAKPLLNSINYVEFLENNNIEVYIVSNKEQSLLDYEAKKHFPNTNFIKILGNGTTKNNKPAADPIFKALENTDYEINQENIWYIGDGLADFKASNSAGVNTILIGQGCLKKDWYKAIQKDVMHFNTYEELLNFHKSII